MTAINFDTQRHHFDFIRPMLLSPRISLKPLAEFCRRMATSLEAGIDVRKIFDRETRLASWWIRGELATVQQAVTAGDSINEGLLRTGECFPLLFREMVEVGEKTGNLAEVFRRLAEYYEYRVKLRRTFLAGITWPVFQLLVALLVIGLLIWIMGFLAESRPGQSIDLLGFGLIGTPGLIIYFTIVVLVLLAVAAVVWAMQRGVLWTRPVQRLIVFLPGVGKCVRTIALARMAWSLHLTLNVEMSLAQVLPLALRSTGNDYYIRHTDQVVADVAGGAEIHEALQNTRAFPWDFITAIEVGEHSGQTVESMGRLSRQYEDQAKAALAMLTVLAGFAVWGIVAAFIVFMIFRLAMFYIGTINDALEY